MSATESERDAFRAGYVRAMLWANTYDERTGESVDAAYWWDGPGKWWEDAPVPLVDADDFLAANYDALVSTGELDFSQHGHDFALTRNGHGAGFWDRGYGEAGESLAAAARVYGSEEIYVTREEG